MLTWRQRLILCVCVIGFSSKGWAETTLIIATGELPPYVSENQKESFLTEVLHQVAQEMGVTFVFRQNGTPQQIHYAGLSDLKGYIIGGVRGYYYEQSLLEAGLHVVNGLEATRHIKATDTGPQTRIVAVTAHALEIVADALAEVARDLQFGRLLRMVRASTGETDPQGATCLEQ
jgi:CheY-like chemotaxis protein